MRNRDSPAWPQLIPDLEPWLNRPFAAMPDHLKARLQDAGFSLTSDAETSSWWDESSPQQRRYRAEWRDMENDPEMEASRQRAWQLVTEHGAVRREIEEWKAVDTPTARDLDIQKAKLAELHKRLAELDSALQPPLNCADAPLPRRRLDAIGQVIQDVIADIGTDEVPRIWGRLTDGTPVKGVNIQVDRGKTGGPIVIIGGKRLTRGALRKRLSRMAKDRDN